MRTDDPKRTSLHEAGHATMAYELGRRVGLVSIRGGPDFFGLTTYPDRRRESSEWISAQLDRPVVLMDARFRRSVETDIMTTAAGYITVRRYGEPQTEAGFEPLELDEARAAQMVQRLTNAEAAELADLEANGAGTLDDTLVAHRTTEALVGDDLAVIYLMALERLTERIVAGERFEARARALADQLLVHEALGARAVRRILKEVT